MKLSKTRVRLSKTRVRLSKTSRHVLASMVNGEKCCPQCAMLHHVLPHMTGWAPPRPDKGHAWVYLTDPRFCDYASSLNVRTVTVDVLQRAGLIQLESERSGVNVNVPMRWWTLTEAGRRAAEEEGAVSEEEGGAA